jgi:hypothetical protein
MNDMLCTASSTITSLHSLCDIIDMRERLRCWSEVRRRIHSKLPDEACSTLIGQFLLRVQPALSKLGSSRALPSGEPGAQVLITSRTNNHVNPPTSTTHTYTTSSTTPRSKSKTISKEAMASRVLRPAFRASASVNTAARGFQTSAALRQEAPLVAPVRRPVGAFRGG